MWWSALNVQLCLKLLVLFGFFFLRWSKCFLLAFFADIYMWNKSDKLHIHLTDCTWWQQSFQKHWAWLQHTNVSEGCSPAHGCPKSSVVVQFVPKKHIPHSRVIIDASRELWYGCFKGPVVQLRVLWIAELLQRTPPRPTLPPPSTKWMPLCNVYKQFVTDQVRTDCVRQDQLEWVIIQQGMSQHVHTHTHAHTPTHTLTHTHTHFGRVQPGLLMESKQKSMQIDL